MPRRKRRVATRAITSPSAEKSGCWRQGIGCLCQLWATAFIVHAGDRDPPRNICIFVSLGRWQWQTCASRSITSHLGSEVAWRWAHIAEEDCAEKIIYALGSCQGSACDVMLVGEGDLPRSGASRRIRGRAYADLNGPWWRLCAADAARLLRETGRAITLWAPGLDDPNQDCVAVWGSITGDQQRGALFSPDGYMACGHGMQRASSRCWSSQRARSS